MLIEGIEKNSIADELGLESGDKILSLNGVKLKDIIEYRFMEQVEELELHIKKKNGEEELIEIEKDLEESLGISFVDAVFDRIKPCTNKCIFCFVDQQPKGLRKSLYVKDDDWRLSYLQGTYITLTNFKEEDWERLSALRLSPLYISIHSTNPDVRIKMLNNKRAGNILENLKRLKSLDIDIHGQIVLCPGYNDGKELKRTLDDLRRFKRNLKSLAVVPVGVSKYRVENLKTVNKKIAEETLDLLDDFNKAMKKNVAMASDEIFLLAERSVPDRKYYGKFVQIEDGVGAIRLFSDSFEKLKKKMKKSLKKPVKFTLITGEIGRRIFEMLDIQVENMELEIPKIKNDFFGEKITVAGLITGSDVLKTLEGREVSNIILPSVMLREGTEEFLDGITLDNIRKSTGAQIFIVSDCYDFGEILAIINKF